MRYAIAFLLALIASGASAANAVGGGQETTWYGTNGSLQSQSVATRAGVAMSTTNTGYIYLPQLYNAYTRTDTGTWYPTLGMSSLVLDVTITEGGSKSATIYLTVSNTITGRPTGSAHGTLIDTFVASGFRMYSGLSAHTKLRIAASNGATVSVGAIFMQASINTPTAGAIWVSNITSTEFTLLREAAQASATSLENMRAEILANHSGMATVYTATLSAVQASATSAELSRVQLVAINAATAASATGIENMRAEVLAYHLGTATMYDAIRAADAATATGMEQSRVIQVAGFNATSTSLEQSRVVQVAGFNATSTSLEQSRVILVAGFNATATGIEASRALLAAQFAASATQLQPMAGDITQTGTLAGITSTRYSVSGTTATQHAGNALMTSNPSIYVGGGTGTATPWTTIVGGTNSTGGGVPNAFVGIAGTSLQSTALGNVALGNSNNVTPQMVVTIPTILGNFGVTGGNQKWFTQTGTSFTDGAAAFVAIVADSTGTGGMARLSGTPTGRGTSLMVSVEGTQVPIAQADATGLSVAANMTVTPYLGTNGAKLGNALKAAAVGSCSPMAGSISVPAVLGATLVMPSGTFAYRLWPTIDHSSTVVIHSSMESMVKSAADNGESAGTYFVTLSKSDIPVSRGEIFHTNLAIPATGVTLYLWTPGGTVLAHYSLDVVVQ